MYIPWTVRIKCGSHESVLRVDHADSQQLAEEQALALHASRRRRYGGYKAKIVRVDRLPSVATIGDARE